MSDPFPLGKPVNRPKPAEHKPEREDIKKGIFSVDGKLQTELTQKGPRFAPKPPEPKPVENWDGLVIHPDMELP